MATGTAQRETGSAARAASSPAGGWQVLALGAVLYGIALATVARDESHWATSDLVIYRHAGLVAWHSGGLYTASFGTARFTYPPFAALMFEPLAMPLAATRWIMTAASLAALAYTAWVAAGAAGVRARTLRGGTALMTAFAALWADPVMSALTWGQVDLLLMAITLADLCQPEHRRWKGAGTGLAAGIKLTPLIFIPYLLVTRRRRAALTAAGAFGLTIMISFAVLPRQASRYWLDGLFIHQQRVGYPGMLPDQSLDGIITRLAGTGHGSWYAWVAASVITGAAGITIAALAHRRGMGLLAIAACAVTGLLTCPISWDHHWVWIILVPVAALGMIRDRGLTPGTVCLLALAALFLDYPISSGTSVSTSSALDGLIWATTGNPGHWHGPQLITSNLYILAGLAILSAIALGAARGRAAAGTSAGRSPRHDSSACLSNPAARARSLDRTAAPLSRHRPEDRNGPTSSSSLRPYTGMACDETHSRTRSPCAAEPQQVPRSW